MRRIPCLPLLLAVALTGCTDEVTDEKVFTFNNGSEPETLDMHKATGVPENRLATALFEGLVGLHPKTLEPIPAVATRWEISDDLMTYTFHLRKDAKWSNGRVVTAKDFDESWKRALTPSTGCLYGYMFFPIQGAEYFHRGLFSPISEKKKSDKNKKGLDGDLIDKLVAADLRYVGDVVRAKPKALEAAGIDEAGQKALKGYLASIGMTQGKELPGYPDRKTLEKIEKGDVEAWSLVGSKVVDDFTFQVRLREPCAYFLDLAAFKTLFPVPMWKVRENPDGWAADPNLISNGPFKLEEWRSRERIVMVPNEHYWDAKRVKLDKLVALPIEDIEAAYKKFLVGECDWNTTVPSGKLDEAKRREAFYSVPYLGTYFYRFNTKKAPFDDKRVRKAFSLAFDRRIITDDLLRDGRIPSPFFCPDMGDAYTPPKGFSINTEEARKLLREAGYKVKGEPSDGKELPAIELLYNTSEDHKKIAEAIAQQWKENLGVQMSLRNTEWKVYLENVRQEDYMIARAGWIGDYSDPNTFLDMWVTGGGNNNTGWSNADYDRLIREAANEGDAEKRKALLHEAEKIVVEDEFPILPICIYVNKGMLSKRVRGFHFNILDHHLYQYIDVVDSDSEE